MAATAQASLASRVRRWSELLPLRVDDPRLWIATAIGVLLRWAVLQGSWWPLRQGLTLAVVHSLEALGLSVEMADRATFAVGPLTSSVSLSCTHLEVLALLGPLLWLPARSLVGNVGRLSAAVVVLALLAVVRIDVAVLLSQQGVPWVWAHDVLLGGCYAVLVGLALHLGGFVRPSEATA